jgi:hypothetical protein
MKQQKKEKVKVTIEIDKDLITALMTLLGIEIPKERKKEFDDIIKNTIIDDSIYTGMKAEELKTFTAGLAMMAIGIAGKKMNL